MPHRAYNSEVMAVLTTESQALLAPWGTSEVSTGRVDHTAEPLDGHNPTERLQLYHAKCLYHVQHQGCEPASMPLEVLSNADCIDVQTNAAPSNRSLSV
jgi:hypothetical protein